MNGRERLLTAINNGKPDRLPCLIHAWVDYHLKTFMNGMDQFQAYEHIGMDPVIYVLPNYNYSKKQNSDWITKSIDLGVDADGNHRYHNIISTPEGELHQKNAHNIYTSWITEHMIKNEKDFDIWNKYVPLPDSIDWNPVIEAREKVGDNGIVRGYVFDFGQLSPWQTFTSELFGVEPAILECFDNPDWMHYVMESLLKKKLTVLGRTGIIPYDLVESGGGAGSSTVISPDLHKEFCLPYDQIQHKAIHEYGTKIVYHLCGGVMPMLELVAENGSDGLETMTPPGMGGNADLAEANKRVGDKLFFIGGFDQHEGLENGNPEIIRKMVFNLHSQCPDGGYICAPSDQFFYGSVENLRAFSDACKECKY